MVVTTREIAVRTGVSVPTVLMAIRYVLGEHRCKHGVAVNLTADEANRVLAKIKYQGNVDLF